MSAIPLEDEAPSPERNTRTTLRVMTSRRVAVIMFNLGGPDSLEAVRPFLFNLFNDGAIISVPQPFRFLLAQLISRTREKSAQENYAKMGGKSPLLEETEKQARALEHELAQRTTNVTFKCFPAMRYWRPFTKDAARAAKDWGATDVILLPLYPQFSTTTTGSSLKAWRGVSDLPAATICCHPSAGAFAEAHADAIIEAWRAGGSPAKPRVLFSAHGLPQRVIDAGDPYQWQIEKSAEAIRTRLPADWETSICYQSRVGPLKWIGPSTEEEIERAGHDKRGVIVSPIAFVSEHIETLVELDIDYAQRAEALGLPYYLRAKALGVHPRFIAALADLTERALAAPGTVQSESGGRVCPAACGACPHG
ncbi:MAG: ferrochelatase [Hyphomonadaceae bacterium]|nr:ferrochelatase [Hyphomonadaceae bacterium]